MKLISTILTASILSMSIVILTIESFEYVPPGSLKHPGIKFSADTTTTLPVSK